jgi:hypothetical protein
MKDKHAIILIPPIGIMVKEVEMYIYMKTGRKVNIVFNNPFHMHEHIEMLRDAYKIIKTDEFR